MSDETWADLEAYHGDAVGVVDRAASRIVEELLPGNEMNYATSEGVTHHILRDLKHAGFRIVRD